MGAQTAVEAGAGYAEGRAGDIGPGGGKRAPAGRRIGAEFSFTKSLQGSALATQWNLQCFLLACPSCTTCQEVVWGWRGVSGRCGPSNLRKRPQVFIYKKEKFFLI